MLAARTSEDRTLVGEWLVRGDGTAGMTRLTTAPQGGIIGDRCQTDHTLDLDSAIRRKDQRVDWSRAEIRWG